jgi:hypothetical protein
MTNPNELNLRWPEVIGLAWADEDFRQRLLADPQREIQALGIDVPGSAKIRILEESDGETILVVPRRPARLRAMAVRQTGRGRGTYSTSVKCSADDDEKKKDDDDQKQED